MPTIYVGMKYRSVCGLIGLIGALLLPGCGSKEEVASKTTIDAAPVNNSQAPPASTNPAPTSSNVPFQASPVKHPLTPLVPAKNSFEGDLTGTWTDERGNPAKITADGQLDLTVAEPNGKSTLVSTGQISQKAGVVTIRWTGVHIQSSDPKVKEESARIEANFMKDGPGSEVRYGSILWKTPDKCVISLQSEIPISGNKAPSMVLTRRK